MFDKRYSLEIDAVLSVIDGFGKGDIVPWSVIESAMNRPRTSVGGWTIIRRARKRLLRERQIVTLPEVEVGVRLLTDQQAAAEIPTMRQKRARRQINRGIRETDAVDVSMLTPWQAAALAVARKHMKENRLAISRANRESEVLSKPSRGKQ